MSDLDQILRDIEQSDVDPSLVAPTQSAGMHDIQPHLLVGAPQQASPMAWMDQGGGMRASQTLLGNQSEHTLTPRQERLPKLNLRLFGSVLAVFVMIVGLSSATFLAGQNQDVRQQAYDGKWQQTSKQLAQGTTVAETSPEVTATSPEEQATQMVGDFVSGAQDVARTSGGDSIALWTPAFWGGVFLTFALVLVGLLMLWIFQG